MTPDPSPVASVDEVEERDVEDEVATDVMTLTTEGRHFRLTASATEVSSPCTSMVTFWPASPWDELVCALPCVAETRSDDEVTPQTIPAPIAMPSTAATRPTRKVGHRR